MTKTKLTAILAALAALVALAQQFLAATPDAPAPAPSAVSSPDAGSQ